MKVKRKLIVSMLAIVFVLLAVVATIAITFALTQQTIKTTLNISYTVEDIDGTASATFTVGGVTESLTAMKGDTVIGDKLVFKAGDTENTGSLEFPEDGLALTRDNDNVVIQYTYSNTGAKHYIASMSFDAELNYDNMIVEYSIDGTNYSEQRYAVVVPANTSNKSYWIRIKIDNKAKSASFKGDFDWLLSGCDEQSKEYLSLPSVEFQQATDWEGNAITGGYSASFSEGSEYVGELVFPSEVNGDPVTTIGANNSLTQEQKDQVTSIYIPDSVKTIADEAFCGYTNLKTVTFQQNETISNTSVQTVKGLTYIGSRAFDKCISLKEFIIPNTLSNIGILILYECPNLIRLEVMEGNPKYHSVGNCIIETANKILIQGCKTSKIPTDGSVTVIGYGAFAGCTGLTEIVIPDSVTSLTESVFAGCTGLTTITIGSGLTSFGLDPFYECINLSCIKATKGNVTYYSEGNCLINIKTKSVVLGCKTSVIPDGVTSIGWSAFAYCTGLTEIVIPDSVTSIDDCAFYGCSSLTSIKIGKGLANILEYGLTGLTSLTSIVVDDENQIFHSENNCLIETATKTLVLGCNTSIIPTDGSVTNIGYVAFNGSGLIEIVIPDSVTTITAGAFCNNTNLTSVTFENKAGWKMWDYNRLEATIEENQLIEPADAAKLLKDNYGFTWIRE